MTETESSLTGEVLVYTRVFAAPRDLVFACLTEPAHLTHFWGPTGVSAPLADIQVDLRVGGTFRTVMVAPYGGRYPTEAVYLAVEPPALLSWRELHSGMLVTSSFTELPGGRTELRIEQRHVPATARTPQARTGFASSLDKFAAYLGDRARTDRAGNARHTCGAQSTNGNSSADSNSGGAQSINSGNKNISADSAAKDQS